MKKILLFLLLLTQISMSGQSKDTPENIVRKFFVAMHDIDTAYLSQVVHKDASLSTTSFDVNKKGVIKMSSAGDFPKAVARSKVGELDEQISNLRIENDGSLANVWMDYSFYYQGKFSHCGVNNFSLALMDDEWKIIALSDTRRKENCIYDIEKNNINTLLNNWHLAATNADSTSYFDLMTENSIFIGTDKTEVWSKSEFLNFAAPYFAKGKAWDFKTLNRNIYSSDFEAIAWFDELLDTWMGPCRGSGVVVKRNGEWFVQHYVLSVTVPNDDVQEFLKIYEK